MHHIHNLSSRNVVSRLSEMPVSDIETIIVPIIEPRARKNSANDRDVGLSELQRDTKRGFLFFLFFRNLLPFLDSDHNFSP